MSKKAPGSPVPPTTNYAGISRNPRAIVHPVESKRQKTDAIRIGLEELGLSIVIAARRAGLRINEAARLYTEFNMEERARLRAVRLRSIA